MGWFLYLTGFLWIAAGATVILYSEETKTRLPRILADGKEIFLSAIACVFGLLLIVAAFASIHPLVIFIFGVIAVAKGLILFFNPMKLKDKLVAWWTDRASDQVYRLSGIILIVIGTAILSWVK